ncbi:MAG: YhgE/Pip domain-containing protein [Solibacillus sp.]
MMLKKEWQSIWQDKKFTLSIIVMFFMPLLYAGMLLYAFWDPYHNLEKLPVAIVNEDIGAELDGEPLQLGDDLTEELLGNKDLNFIEIAADEAERGLLNEEYYLLVRVPENFSQHATTLLDAEPKKMELEYLVNEGSNFLSAQIGGNAIEKIRVKVNEEVAKTYATGLYEAITKLGDGFVEAADAATKIEDGVTKVADGSKELKGYLYDLAAGTVTLSDGTTALQKGVNSAANGAGELAAGAANLTNGATSLQQGMQDAANGASELASGVEAYTSGVADVATGQQSALNGQEQLQQGITSIAENSSSLAEGATSLQQGATNVAQGFSQLQQQLEALKATMPEEQAAQLTATLNALQEGTTGLQQGAENLATGATGLQQGAGQLEASGSELLAGHTQIAQGLGQLTANTESLQQGAQGLQQGTATIADKMGELTAGTVKLADGTNSLTNGLQEIRDGANSLTEGTSELSSKSYELADGSTSLVDGADELKDGSGKLATSLADAGEEAQVSSTDKQIEMTVSPVELKETVYNEVDNYGVGFAPYFISLGLFVGALLLTNVYPYVQPVGQPTGLVSWFMSKSSVVVVVAVFQMILTYTLFMVLGVEVESTGWLIAVICISSFAFMALVQVLTVVLGDVGRFLALIFLVVQLAGSAGTFPLELLPAPLQTVHHFLPMSYSVHAFRAALSTNDTAVLTQSLTVLGTIGVVSVIISFTFFALLYKRRYSKGQQA